MNDVAQTSQGPRETSEERLARAPRVLEGYARDIEKHGRPLDSGLPDLLRFVGEQIGSLRVQRDGWQETAAQHCRNEFYYAGLLDEIAKSFGEAACISDDGSRQQDPLRAKMPELVAALAARATSSR